ncbi:glutamyl-tRNA reductase, partial [Candidatus Micrarchaeota archaeon]|nr:glutamyl-tRNA reductase [Candidatus Micrarchaeota archaeon]
LYVKREKDAIRHVFRVAASLDSMVLGEPQILGQVKDAYRKATRSRSTGPILNRLMHKSFFTAKRVRNETGVGLAAVSVAYAAVELGAKILGDLRKRKVLLVGAGEMAELAARHLMRQVDSPMEIANRTYETAVCLAEEMQGCAVEMESVNEAIERADVVITSTASCEPIIHKDLMKKIMKNRRYKPIFFIDIAIPRDVDPEVEELEGVYLYNIDDLQSVVTSNEDERKKEAQRGELIINQEVDKFSQWLTSLDSAPTIVALLEKMERIRSNEISKMNGKLSGLTQEQKEAIEAITKGIINKIAHDPIVFLKKMSSRNSGNHYTDVTQKMFHLMDDQTNSEDFQPNENHKEL